MSKRPQLGQVKLPKYEAATILDDTMDKCRDAHEEADETRSPDVRRLLAAHANGCYVAVARTADALIEGAKEKRLKIKPHDLEMLKELRKDANNEATDAARLALDKRAPLSWKKQKAKWPKEKKTAKGEKSRSA